MSKRYVKANPVSAELGESSAKGTPQVKVEFKAVENGEKFTWYGYLTDKAAARTVESLRYCGWIGNDIEKLSVNPSAEVDLAIQPEEYPAGSGKWTDRVAFVNAPRAAKAGGGSVDKGLAQKLKGVIAKVDAQLKAGGAKAPSDDVPF